MTDKLDKILQNKRNYFNWLMRVFKPLRPVSEFSEMQPAVIPKAFRKLDPSDMHWVTYPHRILPVFQKMIMHIQDPARRMAALNNLVVLTDSTSKPYIDGHRMHLQDQIFRGITGRHYGEPVDPSIRFSSIAHEDLQSRDFFRLIGMGIHAYESMSTERREEFNQAVMPKVKKQHIEIPYRLQQYARR